MKRRGLIRDTTGYILNGGITFLTVSSRLMSMLLRQFCIE